jgi:hypothetical protein
MEETPREKRHRLFDIHKTQNPGTSYAQWLHQAAVNHVKQGHQHATLGSNLGSKDWWDAGRTTFERYRKLGSIEPGAKVVDYGCGSLRVGGHLIRHLEPEHYFGLDVTTGLIDAGKELVGADLLAEKRPQFGPIDKAALKKAAAFGPTHVISTAVCYHVHPDEAPFYFGNLKQLANKPGATALFDVSISDAPSAEHQLSRPLDYFIEAMVPLEFVAFHVAAKRNGEEIGVIEFRQPVKTRAKTGAKTPPPKTAPAPKRRRR